ncbi:MAG: DUF2694 family protein [Mycobacteriaceae bacterium]
MSRPGEPDPEFDTVHPSGHLMFRSSRGGYMHSVVLSEAVRDHDAASLADAVLRAADVSHLKAMMQIRREITEAGFSPSAEMATPADLGRAEAALQNHRLAEGQA